MSFAQFALDARLQQGVAAMGFTEPTPIQAAAIPPALQQRDILGSAETGTGKTAAYLLPVMQHLLGPTTRHRKQAPLPRVLILVPTRELALQVNEHAERLGSSTGLSATAVFGGVSLGNQEKVLRRGVDIIIATPGRLLDHVQRKNITLTGIEIFVLDEADRMLDVGFLPDIRRVAKMLPKKRQTMLFSATLQPVLELANEVTHNPVRVGVEKTAAPTVIEQTLVPVPENRKQQALEKLLRQEKMETVLVFTRTKHRADRVARNLQRGGIHAAVIHSNRSQNQRIAALQAFRNGDVRILVATDIAARGIDVEGVSHVVNYDMPSQAEDYVHRIGRTGRAQMAGAAFTLITPADEVMVRKVETILKQRINRHMLEGISDAAPTTGLPDVDTLRRYLDEKQRGRKPGGAGVGK
ncbi:MAG: DEAD/DEAH box helicase [Caldilineales bacterium]